MIEIKRTGICEDCPYIDAEVTPLYSNSLVGGTQVYALAATCKHLDACLRIKAMYEKKEA